ncbi:putative G-protein coupled receptors family 2 profile 2 domain-containing protein [Seiridium unicorne]|uniref:G-protein coupled receptors family 2 profile 2 domain-containing protein n=1 Tax=Seiridium unicorne TaxID=138068 RepID=A0ABR2UEL7_9PEZI
MSDNSTTKASANRLTQDQIQMIVAFERAGAGLSVIGLLCIFVAFGTFKRLRTVANTFIVFASFANLGASIACLIGYNGVDAGRTSTLCQAQAFMFELFMQSDPWWSFAMAVNVYMVFFFAANPSSFLSYWWAYFLVCYGIPLIPSLCLLLLRDQDWGRPYGNATIWCWIDKDWSGLRIWTYYLPIWVCILLSTVIYVAVGVYVFNQRNQLRNLSLSDPSRERTGHRDSAEKRLHTNAAGMGSIATEVLQTTTIHVASPSQEQDLTVNSPVPKVNWFAGPPGSSSANANQENDSTSPTYHTVTQITAEHPPQKSWYARLGQAYKRWCGKFSNMDPIKFAYLRTSFIFAISVLVTWTPSSINRVHDLATHSSASFGLNLASGIVLPLQGLWNAFIFFLTSWRPLKEEFQLLMGRMRGLPRGHHAAAAVRNERERDLEMDNRAHRKGRDDTSSVVTGSTMRVMRDGSLSSL